jgi:PLD-like domain
MHAWPRRSGASGPLSAENLEHMDVALIDGAKHDIDLAAYVLTDWPVIQALTRAADRGVKVRIYLDGTRAAEAEDAKPFRDLAETPDEIRAKGDNTALMHLITSYQIDGRCCAPAPRTFQRLDSSVRIMIWYNGAPRLPRPSNIISRRDLRPAHSGTERGPVKKGSEPNLAANRSQGLAATFPSRPRYGVATATEKAASTLLPTV